MQMLGERIPEMETAKFFTCDCFMACRLRDAPILAAAVRGVRQYFPVQNIYVATHRRFQKALQELVGNEASILDEADLLPEMKLSQLAQMEFPHFPGAAGWYYQQFLKFAFAANSHSDFCLIWDADTIPLRPLEFWDGEGRTILTYADEFHQAYFDTFHALFGYPAPSKRSFISQHILVKPSIMRELMIDILGSNHGGDHWSWRIMKAIPVTGVGKNLFSEYETYGNYLCENYPDQTLFRELSWRRSRSEHLWHIPSIGEMEKQAPRCDFIALEAKRSYSAKVVYKILEKYAPEGMLSSFLKLSLRQTAERVI